MSDIDIEKFDELKAEIDYESIMDMYADRCLSILKNKSPKGRRTSKKYAEGWEIKETKVKQGNQLVIWNKTNWQLTHLLENGHLIVNKKGGVGWASAVPHIEESYQEIKNQYITAMENVDVKIDIK
jgi:hypothetical protein